MTYHISTRIRATEHEQCRQIIRDNANMGEDLEQTMTDLKINIYIQIIHGYNYTDYSKSKLAPSRLVTTLFHYK